METSLSELVPEIDVQILAKDLECRSPVTLVIILNLETKYNGFVAWRP